MQLFDDPADFLGTFALHRGLQNYARLMRCAQQLRKCLGDQTHLCDGYLSNLLAIADQLRFSRFPEEWRQTISEDLAACFHEAREQSFAEEAQGGGFVPPFPYLLDVFDNSSQLRLLGMEISAMPEFQALRRFSREINCALGDPQPLIDLQKAFGEFFAWHGPADVLVWSVCDTLYGQLNRRDERTGIRLFQALCAGLD